MNGRAIVSKRVPKTGRGRLRRLELRVADLAGQTVELEVNTGADKERLVIDDFGFIETPESLFPVG